MILPTLSPGLLYALLTINPAAVNTLASTPSTGSTSAALRQDSSSSVPPSNPSLSHRSIPSLSYRLNSHRSNPRRRQEIPDPIQTLVNATVSCREGEFQNPGDDIASVVCGDYYKCSDGTEAERDDPDGEGGEVAVWTAECFGCVAGQASDRASGCVWTEL